MAKMTKEQERAVLFDNGNILISASAGSGKTHTMIERVKRLILSGKVDVDQILAVTFTETAAADMKEKLKKALVKSADLDRKRIYKQLALIPTADISTLHAFCARLIRAYFFVVGLSPDFNIVDEADAAHVLAVTAETAVRANTIDTLITVIDVETLEVALHKGNLADTGISDIPVGKN